MSIQICAYYADAMCGPEFSDSEGIILRWGQNILGRYLLFDQAGISDCGERSTSSSERMSMKDLPDGLNGDLRTSTPTHCHQEWLHGISFGMLFGSIPLMCVFSAMDVCAGAIP
jgi:hypothetical protein